MDAIRHTTCPKCLRRASEMSSRPGYYACWWCGHQWKISKREQQRREVEEYWRKLLFLHQSDPLRDCNYLLSLPRVCPGKAYRN